MGPAEVRCSRCHEPVMPGAQYCTRCGEAVDPPLVAELRKLYGALDVLDEWIHEGKGSHTVLEIRKETMDRYLMLRTPPTSTSTSAPPNPTGTPQVAAENALVALDAPNAPREAAAGASGPAPAGSASMAPPGKAVTSAAPAPVAVVFSWRAFIAEQAIALMAYLGGFLLLIATLSFELGGWQVLSNGLKLLAVCVVYGVFGALGLAFRRATRLETVGRAYLAIFALMTPLVALAAYRFELQQNGISLFGMVCLAATYAAAVYLLLAWRTSFATYAYLGWAAFGVAVLAIVPWVHAPEEWTAFALATLALVLLAIPAARDLAFMATLWEPAQHLSGIASVAAGLGTAALGLRLWSESGGTAFQAGTHSTPAYALAACALVPLALMWSRVARRKGRTRGESLDLLDWLIAASGAQAAIAGAAALGANVEQMAYVLAALAPIEMGLAASMLRVRPERKELRYLLEGLALTLAVAGALSVWGAPSPNWPLAVALAAGTIVTLAVAIAERQPLWLIAAGSLLSLAYHTALVALLPAATNSLSFLDPTNVLPIYFAGLALVEWGVASGLSAWTNTKRYAQLLYLVALGNAVYVTLLLPGHSRIYATMLLAVFAIAALAAGRIGNMPAAGGIATGFFGVLAVLLCGFDNPDGVVVTATAVIPALAALAVRRWLGRRWAYAPYVIALWAALLANTQLTHPEVTTADWSVLGVPYVAWLTFALTALASMAARWENDARAMLAPAALALLGFATVQNALAMAVLVVVVAAVGLAWRERRDPWGALPWYAAAALASPLAVARVGDTVSGGTSWRVVALLAYATCAYLLAARERRPVLTALAGIYGVAALALIPGPYNLVPTLILTFALASSGIVIRQGVGRAWVLVFYAVAASGSLFAMVRIVPYDAGTAEALLLIFAAIAYLAAAFEREPLAGVVPALYAAAVIVARPDAHALLPLALLVGMLALAASRTAGPRWAWPLYTVAAVTGGTAAALGATSSGFDAWALLTLALLAYIIAALESRPDVIPLALVLGGLALASCAGARGWIEWQTILTFVALAWLYFGLQIVWRRIPWLTQRGFTWWAGELPEWSNPRTAGTRVHGWAGVALAVGTAATAVIEPRGFAPRAAPTEVAVVALLSCGAMLVAQAWVERRHGLWYAAGELVALAVTWQLRWLGADNIQAFVLAPGSYQILVGVLLPSDERVGWSRRGAQWFSASGALLILVPTLSQSFLAEPGWIYALLLALEALLIAGVGAGTRSRLLVLTGSVFVGAAAIRGAILAVNSNVPIALVIAALALILMGGATWLSLRARREAHETPPA